MIRRYRVGGAVRDELLGLPVDERDWVVVGSTPAAMQAAGYRPVGRHFPVFLHPQSGEEHALARTERKAGRGYHGFVFHAGPEVSLEDDLQRRDLTINAMARADDDRLIDPCNGRRDLDERILRHVSDAFVEDPVRLLRLARFYTRFAPLGFRVADETMALLRTMVANGEVDHLVPERVWAETRRALLHDEPQLFFHLLRECGALAHLFPELDALFGVPQPAEHHPEIDSGIHTLLALRQTALLDAPLTARYATLCHDYGKALTPAHKLPAHHGHEQAGVPLTEACSRRMGVPRQLQQEAVLATRWHTHIHRFPQLRAGTVLKLFEAVDALRRPERLHHLLLVCEADVRGRLGFEHRSYRQPKQVRAVLDAAAAVDAAALEKQGLRGPEIGAALRRERLAAIAAVHERTP